MKRNSSSFQARSKKVEKNRFGNPETVFLMKKKKIEVK